MQTRIDVAKALGITDRQLRAALFGLKLRQQYHSFEIPKRSGGTRQISKPHPFMLHLQRKLYELIRGQYDPKPCVHGFVRARSIVSNSRLHVRRRIIANIDLRNFFPSIHLGRVRGVFTSGPFSFGREAAETLAQICCRDDGTLPQGGAMSPLISNFICRGLDHDMLTLAQRLRLRYSRYADDLTFSTDKPSMPTEIIDYRNGVAVAGDEITAIVNKNGFDVAPEKVRLRSHQGRQDVTGIVVNHFPNLPRKFVRNIDGALYAWAKKGYPDANQEYRDQYINGGGVDLENVLRGRLAFLKMVRGESDYLYRKLVKRFNQLSTRPIKIGSLLDLPPSRLRSSAPNVAGWNHWAEKYRAGVFLMQVESTAGDICAGSAFHIGHGILATAGHNLIDATGVPRTTVTVFEKGVGYTPLFLNSSWQGRRGVDVGATVIAELSRNVALPTQLRLPELGEEVAALGFPKIPQRFPTMVLHVGVVEALPASYVGRQRFIQVSFQSGGGLSGGCLIDKAGYVIGIMIENVFMGEESSLKDEPDEAAEATEVTAAEATEVTEAEATEVTEAEATEVKAAMRRTSLVPQRPYGQAVPIEYLADAIPSVWAHGVPPTATAP